VIYGFEDFVLDTDRQELRRSGERIAVEPQVFDLLHFLIANRERVVSKDDIFATVWEGRIVSESALTSRLTAARHAVGDSGAQQRLIRTFPRKGHRFVGKVREERQLPDAQAEPQAPRHEGDGPAPAAPPAVGGAGRRQLTIMACDVVGSVALAHLDPEDLQQVVATCLGRVREVVEGYGGFVAASTADGILVHFGYPQAHEDDAERAIRAGLALTRAVADLEIGRLARPVQPRIGIATGVVVIGDPIGPGAMAEPFAVGETPHLAARLLAVADPGAVVISAGTRRLVGRMFDCADMGGVAPKGAPDSIAAFRVLRESAIASRFRALRSSRIELVGRDEELALLRRRWDHAKAGEGRVVLIGGEPGIGKSRLVAALENAVRKGPHASLSFSCSPHHQHSALFPVVAQLERAAGFARDDPPALRRDKLATLLGGDATAPDDLPLIAELLSLPGSATAAEPALSPQRKKELTFAALLRRLDMLASRQPVLMVFEDLHWMDPSTRELLDRTIARIEGLPVLLIATFRPEFQPPWAGQPHVAMLALPRLGRREGAALVRGLLADGPALAADIVDEIVERSDGVPLFLEEVTKVVLEAAASPEAARDSPAAIPGARPSVPPTLQASLMARLDRLGPAAREVAQVGAAIGREFSHELLLAAAPRGAGETGAALDRLVDAGLVFQRGVPPAAEYRFKHALVQDTAYGSLLRGPRQALHARIAAAMRERETPVAQSPPEVRAHHLAEAGEHEAAAAYWLDAGRRAAGRSANVEAVAHLTRGIAGLKGLPETSERRRQELTLQLALGPALMSASGFGAPQAVSAYERACHLAETVGDDRARFAAVWGSWLATGQTYAPEVRGSREALVDELFRVAERLPDPGFRMQAHHSAWATVMWRGKLVESREHVRQGLELFDRDRHGGHALVYGGHDPGVCGYGQGAMTLWLLGYPDQAAKSAQDGIDLAATLAHAPSLGHALWFAAVIGYFHRDVAMVLDRSERLIALGQEHGLPFYRTIGSIMHGWALSKRGHVAEGLPELQQAMNRYRASARTMSVLLSAMLAEAELCAGLTQEAIDQLDASDREAVIINMTFWRTGTLHVMGEALAAQNSAAAEACFRTGLEVARDQQAKSLELRAATSLARLLEHQGRRDEARDLLTPVYGWFTEGFDTPDLKEAATLLPRLT
jgi:class 3 adenylate cyclase